MKLSLAEQETIINYDEEQKTATVYTCRKSLQNRLLKIAEQRPTECKVVKTAREGAAIEFEVPKKWIKVSPPRVFTRTEEQKRAAAERLAKYRAEHAQKE